MVIKKWDEKQRQKILRIALDVLIVLAIIIGIAYVFGFMDFITSWKGRVVRKYIHEADTGDGGTIDMYFIRIKPGGDKKMHPSMWKQIKVGDYIVRNRWGSNFTYGSDRIGLICFLARFAEFFDPVWMHDIAVRVFSFGE